MAWIRWHLGTGGLRYANVQWREPRTGRIRTRALGLVSPEAADEERRHVERVEEKRQPRGRRTVAGTALDGFLARPDSAKDTASFYRHLLGPFFAHMGERPIRSWRRADLESYLATRTWSRRRAQMLVVACKTFGRWAREAKGLDVPDFVGGYRPKPPVHVERPALTGKQLRALLDASRGTPMFLPVALAMFAGLPYGDLVTLRWEDIDLAAKRIGRARKKSGEPQRPPIPDALLAAMKDHRATHGVVCRELPETYSGFRTAVHRLFKRAKVPRSKGQGIHLLRHSYATLAGKHGDLDTVRVLLGHAKGSPATARYLHTDEERLRRASDGVEREILGGG